MPRFYVVSRWWRWALGLLLLAGGGARAQGVPPGQGLVADSTELRVLRELYAATDGPRWAQRAGWDSLAAWTRLPPNGRLYGVVASLGDVVHLELRGNGLAGPLPAAFELTTTYSAAVARAAREPALARRFIEALTGAQSRDLRLAGGFDNESHDLR